MGSYRVALAIVNVRVGHDPAEVMETAKKAVGEVAHLDSSELSIQGTQPWVNVRFSVEPSTRESEDRAAVQVAGHVERAVDQVASFGRLVVSRRYKGTWQHIQG